MNELRSLCSETMRDLLSSEVEQIGTMEEFSQFVKDPLPAPNRTIAKNKASAGMKRKATAGVARANEQEEDEEVM